MAARMLLWPHKRPNIIRVCSKLQPRCGAARGRRDSIGYRLHVHPSRPVPSRIPASALFAAGSPKLGVGRKNLIGKSDAQAAPSPPVHWREGSPAPALQPGETVSTVAKAKAGAVPSASQWCRRLEARGGNRDGELAHRPDRQLRHWGQHRHCLIEREQGEMAIGKVLLRAA